MKYMGRVPETHSDNESTDSDYSHEYYGNLSHFEDTLEPQTQRKFDLIKRTRANKPLSLHRSFSTSNLTDTKTPPVLNRPGDTTDVGKFLPNRNFLKPSTLKKPYRVMNSRAAVRAGARPYYYADNRTHGNNVLRNLRNDTEYNYEMRVDPDAIHPVAQRKYFDLKHDLEVPTSPIMDKRRRLTKDELISIPGRMHPGGYIEAAQSIERLDERYEIPTLVYQPRKRRK